MMKTKPTTTSKLLLLVAKKELSHCSLGSNGLKRRRTNIFNNARLCHKGERYGKSLSALRFLSSSTGTTTKVVAESLKRPSTGVTEILFRNIAIGFGAASFWRGGWYLLDDKWYPNDPIKSSISSIVVGCIGIAACSTGSKTTSVTTMASASLSSQLFRAIMCTTVGRLLHIYVISWSCIFLWRGTWVGWDCLYLWLNENKIKTEINLATSSDASRLINDVSIIDDAVGYKQTSAEIPSQPIPSPISTTSTNSALLSHIPSMIVLAMCGVLGSTFAVPAPQSVQFDRYFDSYVNVNATPGPASAFDEKILQNQQSQQPQSLSSRSQEHKLEQKLTIDTIRSNTSTMQQSLQPRTLRQSLYGLADVPIIRSILLQKWNDPTKTVVVILQQATTTCRRSILGLVICVLAFKSI